ncbi:MAG: biopolymer transporter ExbD [Rubrivivax sp.]|jgi:biopolymer transport protein ExbD|nr:biopolymer transporter ExbD [Betaproteobacteria bacterium]MBP6318961.1 biopolymer transporter ExbD [Rubrivivax sp.]MBK7277412.1 biopolymer transporter ExbD [Betaproteobacteria bacterium]MBK7459371.1 biopolymer transporter ExbD [Betaproteobacteria bacterium]MBK8106129.1 biopolymer transporter ExbD [Betaproteobacteria bacterium]
MRFSRRRLEEPEINLIPFIDVLLVVLIFLMLSTTYSRFTELRINLPAADAEKLRERPGEVVVSVSSDGRYAVNRQAVDGRSVELLSAELAAAAAGRPDTVVIISADAMAAHQAVVNVLDAARRAGLSRLTFAAQTANGAPR